jgi:uncharacterized protein (DUF1330 family)
MPAYLIVDVTVTDPDVYEDYKKLAPSSIAQYGGRYIARGGRTDVLEGAWTPSRLVMLEFPTVEQARAWWSSPEYADPKRMRQRSSTTNMVLVEGLTSPIG